MHKLKLEPLTKEIETGRLPVAKPITVTVPLTDLFARSYCYFYQMHGCTIVRTDDFVGNRSVYRFTFPIGTRWQRGENGYLLTLPDKTCIDVTPTSDGQSYLRVHVDPETMNDVFLAQQEGR